MATPFYLRLPDPPRARGSDPSLSFSAHGAEEFAAQLQQALRTSVLFERWRAQQAEPDEVDPAYGAVDPQATVQGRQHGLHIDLVVTSSLSGEVLRHRLRLLAGSGWELRDVTAA